ncbi:Crp/Fnr family transcriptional regulator [Variovorax sp. dw_954]|uniref:Crp/Fnr family transcriptional regulator n=1 Tax=Variovorax sp. dw_954 TaxID=2720078 RepID=UPI001BD4E7CE
MADRKSSVDVEVLLKRTAFFCELPPEDFARLLAVAKVETFDTRVLLSAGGTPMRWLRLVVRGYIEIVARRASGEEVALADIGRGGWASWAGCFVDEPSDYDFYCSGDACFVALPTASVRAAAQAHPEIYRLVIGQMGTRLRQLMEWTAESVMLGPEQRMGKLIHLLARTHGIDTNSGTLPVTQARLASLARCSRQSANLLLKALEHRGLIRTAYGRFEIDDMTRLAAFIQADRQE